MSESHLSTFHGGKRKAKEMEGGGSLTEKEEGGEACPPSRKVHCPERGSGDVPKTLPAPPLDYVEDERHIIPDEKTTAKWVNALDDEGEVELRGLLEEGYRMIHTSTLHGTRPDWKAFMEWCTRHPQVWHITFLSRSTADNLRIWLNRSKGRTLLQVAVDMGLPFKLLRAFVQRETSFSPIHVGKWKDGETVGDDVDHPRTDTTNVMHQWIRQLFKPLRGQVEGPKDRRWIARGIIQAWVSRGFLLETLPFQMKEEELHVWIRWGIRLFGVSRLKHRPHYTWITNYLREGEENLTKRDLIIMFRDNGVSAEVLWNELVHEWVGCVSSYYPHAEWVYADMHWFHDTFERVSMDFVDMDKRFVNDNVRLWMLDMLLEEAQQQAKRTPFSPTTTVDKLQTHVAALIQKFLKPHGSVGAGRPKEGWGKKELFDRVLGWTMHTRDHMDRWEELLSTLRFMRMSKLHKYGDALILPQVKDSVWNEHQQDDWQINHVRYTFDEMVMLDHLEQRDAHRGELGLSENKLHVMAMAYPTIRRLLVIRSEAYRALIAANARDLKALSVDTNALLPAGDEAEEKGGGGSEADIEDGSESKEETDEEKEDEARSVSDSVSDSVASERQDSAMATSRVGEETDDDDALSVTASSTEEDVEEEESAAQKKQLLKFDEGVHKFLQGRDLIHYHKMYTYAKNRSRKRDLMRSFILHCANRSGNPLIMLKYPEGVGDLDSDSDEEEDEGWVWESLLKKENVSWRTRADLVEWAKRDRVMLTPEDGPEVVAAAYEKAAQHHVMIHAMGSSVGGHNSRDDPRIVRESNDLKTILNECCYVPPEKEGSHVVLPFTIHVVSERSIHNVPSARRMLLFGGYALNVKVWSGGIGVWDFDMVENKWDIWEKRRKPRWMHADADE
jgi:hypothetical protein